MNEPAPLLLGASVEAADGAVVLLHGRGQSPAFMRDAVVRLALPRLCFVLPAAPDNTWYPQSFLRPLAENQPALSRSLAHCDAVIAGLVAAGIAPTRIAVGGFSQGACMTAELLVRHPRALAAAIVWTGGLIGPACTTWPLPAALAGMPVLVTGSDVDPFVPAWRTHETARHFAACGCEVAVRVLAGREHVIADDEIALAARLLARTLPPR